MSADFSKTGARLKHTLADTSAKGEASGKGFGRLASSMSSLAGTGYLSCGSRNITIDLKNLNLGVNSAECSIGNLIADWQRFRQSLRGAETGYTDVIRLLNKIVRLTPSGVKLQLSNVPFFGFEDASVEQGFVEMVTMRQGQNCRSKGHACFSVFLLGLTIYGCSTCDIDKQTYRREWTAVAVVCGLSFLMLPAAVWGMHWSSGKIGQGMQRTNLLLEDELYSSSGKALMLGRVSDGRRP